MHQLAVMRADDQSFSYILAPSAMPADLSFFAVFAVFHDHHCATRSSVSPRKYLLRMKRVLSRSVSNEPQDHHTKKVRELSPENSAEQIWQGTSSGYIGGPIEESSTTYTTYIPPGSREETFWNSAGPASHINHYSQAQAVSYISLDIAPSERLDSQSCASTAPMSVDDHWTPLPNPLPPVHPGTYVGATTISSPDYGTGPARASFYSVCPIASLFSHGRANYAPPRATQPMFRQQEMYDTSAAFNSGSNAVVDDVMLVENMGGTGPSQARVSTGSFYKAQNVVINQPTMIENAISSTSGKPVLEILMPYTDSRAHVDSSARHPPPRCHPDTRKHILGKLTADFNNPGRQFNMIWLRGPAGTGKSAVAQTFAMRSEELGRHGASYFFSRPRGWNKYVTVIPSLIYQLAVNCPPYRNLVANAIANDPHILDKSPPVQFTKLIIHPFHTLQTRDHGRQRILVPFLVALDGLDECESEEAQLELINMIADAVRLHKDLPLFWVICSRIEEHLQIAFTRIAECGRETLAIDAECRDDVERFLRSEFAEIRSKYCNSVPANWPSESDFGVVLRAVNGLFIFGSTVMKDIGSPEYANPIQRLQILISFLKNVEQTAATNPLKALDLFYTCILSDIPEAIFPITWRILAFFIYMPEVYEAEKPRSAQALSNFLDLDQASFYTTLRQLHSVISIPTPEDAFTTPLQFYHASFQDFLLDPQRSGKFFISEQKARVEVLKSILLWHESDSVQFHAADGKVRFAGPCLYNPFPNLKWVSERNHGTISALISNYAADERACWGLFHDLDQNTLEPELLSFCQQLDYRYLDLGSNAIYFIDGFLSWVLNQDPLGGPFRTQPCDDIDRQLLSYMNMVTGKPARPATLQGLWHSWDDQSRNVEFVEYFFIGEGSKSIIVWNQSLDWDLDVRVLDYDKAPTPEMIAKMREYGYEFP
ncbi:hypothetical protein NP233_g7500 [Leucocoprinus birnbaumii]|uniref:Nephrocystin 3-like N-terminal domain-containing protein n=1 Tax=Leucocoprinus birnbaumii TaxID=56174 RepID=A0AAD5VUK5_9AGAR|nr:hypothetical protein NP233_g7500 [Leucocoprinus birnbaumii]